MSRRYTLPEENILVAADCAFEIIPPTERVCFGFLKGEGKVEVTQKRILFIDLKEDTVIEEKRFHNEEITGKGIELFEIPLDAVEKPDLTIKEELRTYRYSKASFLKNLILMILGIAFAIGGGYYLYYFLTTPSLIFYYMSFYYVFVMIFLAIMGVGLVLMIYHLIILVKKLIGKLPDPKNFLEGALCCRFWLAENNDWSHFIISVKLGEGEKVEETGLFNIYRAIRGSNI